MNNLATAHRRHGKYSEAEVLYNQCLDKMKIVRGKSHPNTLTTMGNLAAAYVLQGKYMEAGDLQQVLS